MHNRPAPHELDLKLVSLNGETSTDWSKRTPATNKSSRKSVPNLCHDPIERPIKHTNSTDSSSNYPAQRRHVRTSMAKPSIYRVSQKRQGVIIDTTEPTGTKL